MKRRCIMFSRNIQQKEQRALRSQVVGPEVSYISSQEPSLPTFLQAVYRDLAVERTENTNLALQPCRQFYEFLTKPSVNSDS